MLPFILGGVALAVTGFGIKKYLEDEDNCKKVEDAVDGFINKVEKQTDKFFDYANEKIDELDEKRNGKRESCDENELEDKLCEEVEEVQNDKQSDDSTNQDKNISQTKLWYRPFDWIMEDNKQSDDSTNQDKNISQTKSWNKTSDWI